MTHVVNAARLFKYLSPVSGHMLFWQMLSFESLSEYFTYNAYLEAIIVGFLILCISRIKYDPNVVSPYLIRMRENTDQNNSEYGHFLCSVCPATLSK